MAKSKFSQPCREYVRGLVRYVRDFTGHNEYEISVQYVERDAEEDKWVRQADIDVNPVYLFASINFYPCIAEDFSDKKYREIAASVVHEVCHLYVQPIVDLFIWDSSASQIDHHVNTVERQVQRIRNTVIMGLPDGWWEPKFIQEYCKGSK